MRCLTGIAIVVVFASVPSSAHAVEKAEIDKAVERGVKGLLQLQQGNGSWPGEPGMTALAAVTLLECDVPPTDKAIQKAAAYVRQDSVGATHVYALCTAIFFLDRLGDAVDTPLLEAMTVRLLAGQMETGAWSYETPTVPPEERKRLEDHYRKNKDTKFSPAHTPRSIRDLSPEIQQRLPQIRLQSGAMFGGGDHSNTQFASLALWVGRRQGVPVDGALALLDRHFRTNQNPDGGWGYITGGSTEGQSSPAMTCAGILGLSVAQGMVLMTGRATGPAARAALDPTRDPSLRAALARVAVEVDLPPSVKKQPPATLGGKHFYFLWSLERILVAMDRDKIGGKDWYAWGSELLLHNQQADGKWQGAYGASGADTCFALLFLRKANLAGDLTALLRKKVSLTSSGAPEREPKPIREPKNTTPGEATPSKPPVEARPTFTQPQSARLADSFVKATSAKQGQILEQLRNGKGAEYTEALAGAIPQLKGDEKRKAREALAERLTRMKSDTLGQYLEDDDAEIRRAAALAAGTREFKDQVPALIELLGDKDQGVVLAAHTALKAMTGQKIAASAEPWRAWWKQQAKNP